MQQFSGGKSNRCKPFAALALCAGILLLGACTRSDYRLRIIEPRLGVDQAIAREFATLLNEESNIEVTVVPSVDSEQTGLQALLENRADIALVSNNEIYQSQISTVMPMYSNVLHILVKRSITGKLSDAFGSDWIFAGPPESPSRRMVLQYARYQDIDPDTLRFSPGLDDGCPGIIVIFAPIMRDIQSRLSACGDDADYRLWKDPDNSVDVDAATLLNPSLRAFTIPAGTYGDDISPESIVTLAVDKLLVARSDVPATVIYDLISEVIRLRPALAAVEPTLFHGIGDTVKFSDSTFVLHAGAQAYAERDEPTVYERYSGVAEVAVTVFLAILSGTIAGLRIYALRRKNRIDEFYAEAIRLRTLIDDDSPTDERLGLVTQVRMLQTKAYEMLVDEKLAADESFRIFITLSNDIIRELKQDSAPNWSEADN